MNDDFVSKKMLISLASGGKAEAQTSYSTITSIKQLNNRLNRKATWIHTNSYH